MRWRAWQSGGLAGATVSYHWLFHGLRKTEKAEASFSRPTISPGHALKLLQACANRSGTRKCRFAFAKLLQEKSDGDKANPESCIS